MKVKNRWKNLFKLNYAVLKQEPLMQNEYFLALGGVRGILTCWEGLLPDDKVKFFKAHTEQKHSLLERALNTKIWKMKHYLGEKFKAFCYVC